MFILLHIQDISINFGVGPSPWLLACSFAAVGFSTVAQNGQKGLNTNLFIH